MWTHVSVSHRVTLKWTEKLWAIVMETWCSSSWERETERERDGERERERERERGMERERESERERGMERERERERDGWRERERERDGERERGGWSVWLRPEMVTEWREWGRNYVKERDTTGESHQTCPEHVPGIPHPKITRQKWWITFWIKKMKPIFKIIFKTKFLRIVSYQLNTLLSKILSTVKQKIPFSLM